MQIPYYYDHRQIPIRSGAFSDVYKASFGGKCVAVKVFRETASKYEMEKVEKRLEREIAFAHSLHHKHLLPILGEFKGEGNILISTITPWMQHGNVLDYLAKSKVNRTGMVIMIADALKYLHNQDVVHGHVFPGNVLIADFGMPMITDFGVSAIHEVLRASTIAPIGQLRYLAPEIVLSESIIRASKSTDVYAFACVGMEILSAEEPFHAIQSDVGIILALHDGKSPYPTFTLHDAVSVALHECLNQSAERRPTMDTVYERIALSSQYDAGDLRGRARL
ncbi:uncharacterized protein LACBIDRAFT_295329 [Laccaria bicolor S238N-H82]|uniref:Predicted protein n=1 Tax=Laccaria bicolor (strain S238N-H82 / ATCC MYA-4686) TaxID=486041 RepID=B0DQL9_LACBS|nr:uncharacterized protein LACBIDRAFT_295329 [Laccaria bicolor S238N-H82]EDR03053.1 predicted protein [Laccaria bicolor S238N-H82]|eukprot:XP_001886194.1 predicted protein [Laccaria bicolor S238N-H82]